MKRVTRLISLALLFVLLVITNVSTIDANSSTNKPLKVELAHEWTELFNRTSGWLGADGVYSFALNGIDSIGSANSKTKTFFTFCDTNLGEVNTNTLKWKKIKMGHNSAAVLTGTEPDPEKIQFKYGKNASMSYEGNLVTNSVYGYKVWPQDGILIDNNLYILGHKTDNQMAPLGVDEIKIPIVNGEPDFNNFTVTSDVPLFYQDSKYDISFGAGILDNTKSAGAMDPDGYVYIYGIRCNPSNALDKQLVVARVKKEEFTDKSKWRFFDGKSWKAGVQTVNTDAAVLANYVSNELSVTPIDSGIYKGKYMLIYSVGSIVPKLEYRIGETPYGPFDKPVKFYDIPEPDIYDGAVVYNAKAHPHLSKPGELLISYNVNLWLVIPDTNEIYRPRFLTLKLDEFAEPVKGSKDRVNVAAGKEATASHNSDDAYKAVDKKSDMWVGTGRSSRWLRVDLGDEYTITRWVVKHSSAAGGPTAYNTRDYKLQRSLDGKNWQDVDFVVYNTASKTDRTVEPFNARYVRLYITNPSQSTESAARISEFEVYGKLAEETPVATPTPTPGVKKPTPTPGVKKPTPTPGGKKPTPTPGVTTPTPTPTPGGKNPTPTPGGKTWTPTPGAKTPTPAPVEGTPTPIPGGGTSAPDEETPVLTPGEETPTPTPDEETPAAGEETPNDDIPGGGDTVPGTEPGDETPVDGPTQEDPGKEVNSQNGSAKVGLKAWVKGVIVVSIILVVAGGTVLAVVYTKKKRLG